MALSRSESTALAALSSPGGRTAISVGYNQPPPAAAFVSDSALRFVALRGHRARQRDHPFISILTDAYIFVTGLIRDLRTLSVTSGDLVGEARAAQQPPTNSTETRSTSI